jgi:hypothetical protein
MDAVSEAPSSLRPGWWPVIVGVFLGYLWSLIVLGAAALILTEGLGVIPWSSGATSDGSSPLPGPFEPDGAWSLFANGVIAVTVVAAAAALVTRVVSKRVGERVSLALVFIVLAVTGYAPFLYLEGRFRLSGVAGLLVAAALIRWFAVGDGAAVRFVGAAGDRFRLSQPRTRRLLVVVASVAWSASAGVAVAYGLTHPLGSGAAVDYSPSHYRMRTIGGEEYYLYRGPLGTPASYAVDVRNVGFADLTVEGVELPTNPGFRLASIIISPDPWLPGDATAPPRGRTIPGRSERFLTLDLRLTACTGQQLRTVSRIRLNYSVLGRNESMVLPLHPALATRC